MGTKSDTGPLDTKTKCDSTLRNEPSRDDAGHGYGHVVEGGLLPHRVPIPELVGQEGHAIPRRGSAGRGQPPLLLVANPVPDPAHRLEGPGVSSGLQVIVLARALLSRLNLFLFFLYFFFEDMVGLPGAGHLFLSSHVPHGLDMLKPHASIEIPTLNSPDWNPKSCLAMGQNPVPPVNIPIPTKID